MRERILRWVVRLYPRAWRERYGDEFAAMLDQMPSRGWVTVWDVSKGALAMQATHHGASLGKMAAVFGVAGLVAAGAVSLAIPDVYLSEAEVKVDRGVDEEALLAVFHKSLDREKLERLIQRHALYPGDLDALDSFRKSIRIGGTRPLPDGSRAFRVAFSDRNADLAARVTAELADDLLKQQPGLAILAGASKPEAYFPNRLVIAATGLTAGALMGLAFAIWRRYRSGVRGGGIGVAVEAGKFALAGLALATAASFAIPNRYHSVAVMKVDRSVDAKAVSEAVGRSMGDESLRPIVQRHNLYAGQPDALEALRKNVRIEGLAPMKNGNRAFRVSVASDDPAVASRVTRELTDTISKAQPGLSILDYASRPEQPSAPNRRVIGTAGLLAGLLIGLGVGYRRMRRLPPQIPAPD